MTAAAAGVVWTTAQQRDNEVDLVLAGRQFAAAIERYRALSLSLAANPQALYPQRLEALLSDDRAIQPQHHLRRVYLDPMTGKPHWGLIRLPDGGIVGVHSLSDRKPYPRTFVVAGFSSPGSMSYREWKFVAPSAVEMLPFITEAQPLSAAVEPAAAAEALGTSGGLPPLVRNAP